MSLTVPKTVTICGKHLVAVINLAWIVAHFTERHLSLEREAAGPGSHSWASRGSSRTRTDILSAQALPSVQGPGCPQEQGRAPSLHPDTL